MGSIECKPGMMSKPISVGNLIALRNDDFVPVFCLTWHIFMPAVVQFLPQGVEGSKRDL
jgi:hypothetical protein